MSDPRHTFRYPEHSWRLVKSKAAREGTTPTAVITDRLDDYIDGEGQAPEYVRGPRNIIIRKDEAHLVDPAEPVTPSGLPVAEAFDAPAARTVPCRIPDCECSGFTGQDKRPLYCNECGHGRGVHA